MCRLPVLTGAFLSCLGPQLVTFSQQKQGVKGTSGTVQWPYPRLGAAGKQPEKLNWHFYGALLYKPFAQRHERCKGTTCLYHIHEIIMVHTKGLWEIPYFHPIQLYNTPCFLSFQLWNSTLTQDVGFINYTTSNTFCNITYFSFSIYIRIKCWSLGNTFSAFCVVTSITSPTGIPLILAMYSAAM